MHDYWTLMKKLIWLRILQGASFVVNKITGTSPITLTNAINSAIISLKQYGKCVQDGTPTPSVPVDIVCNNGALKVRKQSGLPFAYKKVEYIEGTTDGQYIDTGFNILSNDVTYSAHYRLMPTGCTNYGGTSSNQWGYMGMNAAFMLTWTGNNGIGASVAGAPYVEGHIYEVTHNRGIGGTRTLRVDDLDIELSTTTSTYTDRPFGIFRLSPFATTYNRIWGRIYEFQGYVDGVLTHDLVPVVRLSDNVAGLYNKANGDFLTNAGTGTFLVGNDVSDPIEIYADGTPEVLTVSASSAETQTTSVANLFAVGDYKDEQDIINGLLTHRVGIKVLTGDASEEWGENLSLGTVYIQGATASWGAVAGVAPICTRLVGLNSGETTFAGACRFAKDFNVYEYKTAFGVLNITEFKAKLVSYYNEGNPIILVYPLAMPTTESVTPHTLTTAKGTNVVEVEAEVDDIELEVIYKGK